MKKNYIRKHTEKYSATFEFLEELWTQHEEYIFRNLFHNFTDKFSFDFPKGSGGKMHNLAFVMKKYDPRDGDTRALAMDMMTGGDDSLFTKLKLLGDARQVEFELIVYQVDEMDD